MDKQITITLNQELIAAINEARQTRSGKTDVEIVMQAFKLGIKQLNYRTERNAKQYAEFKAYRESLKSGE